LVERSAAIAWPAAFTSDRVSDCTFAVGSVPLGRPWASTARVAANVRLGTLGWSDYDV